MVDAAMSASIAANCEQYRRDCIKVLNHLYEIGERLYGESSLGVLPALAAPIVAGGFIISSIAALIGFLEWLNHQDRVLEATLSADTARLEASKDMMDRAKDPDAPEGVKAVAAQNASTLVGATAAGTPMLGGKKKKGFFDGLIPESTMGKAILAYGAWRFGPGLLRSLR